MTRRHKYSANVTVNIFISIFTSFCRFYTLMVLSTALFGKPAFRNLICNGLVLAEDGKKMSKRLKNYPAPSEILDEYGAVSCIYFEYFYLFPFVL